MAIEENIRAKLKQFHESLQEQEAYQTIKEKWNDLDPDSQKYVKMGSGGAAALTGLMILFSMISSVSNQENKYREQLDLLNYIRSAKQEINLLKSANTASQGGAPTGNWHPYFKGKALMSKIEESNMIIGIASPGNPSDNVKETLYEITLRDVNIRQTVQFANALENGPVKIISMEVDTVGPKGWLKTIIRVSAFSRL